MLPAGGVASEIAVIGEVDEEFGAVVGELPDEVREGGFVADEGGQRVAIGLKYLGFGSGLVVAAFAGDLLDPAETGGDVLAKGDEIDLVVAALEAISIWKS